jgi:hypothetical protein
VVDRHRVLIDYFGLTLASPRIALIRHSLTKRRRGWAAASARGKVAQCQPKDAQTRARYRRFQLEPHPSLFILSLVTTLPCLCKVVAVAKPLV